MTSAGGPRLDPLLALVKLILAISMAAFLALAAVIALAAPALFLWRDKVTAQMAAQGAPPEAIWAIVAVLLLVSAMFVLGFYFVRHLYRIVASVGEGDPFVPINARRLSAMAWIAVAVHVMAIPVSMIGEWAETLSPRIHWEGDIPLAGLFLALVLFILARVFREGTRLREELEGTV
ncbi:DUF2975 domain-containing protein [Novosphingobium sp. JCM 18896]|uniref:DUF2975 domain-containing protein n=1 Tax=Novosphingobium sp. JCM 18896 TaxID=2989731 RepID=UPI002221A218|nr:DUF2975 domain-containing protein [Novosphingobium sp. JCM 18896]MCW1431528.1 DUF2975 domain-containing protein [Novosphingobium sp. JCM 18896]